MSTESGQAYTPLTLTYEDLAEKLEGAVRRVLDWLGIPAPPNLDLSRLPMHPQADALNGQWAERYRQLRPWVGTPSGEGTP